jgi:hypothetical protein
MENQSDVRPKPLDTGTRNCRAQSPTSPKVHHHMYARMNNFTLLKDTPMCVAAGHNRPFSILGASNCYRVPIHPTSEIEEDHDGRI